jgi:hypothetical protein
MTKGPVLSKTGLIMSEDDVRYLDLLSVFHYVVAGVAGLIACIPIVHLVIGILLVVGTIPDPQPAAPIVGWIFIVIPGVMILLGWTFAICMAMAGRFLARREHYTFCLVMSGVECIFVPFGTVLGILTLIVLTKPEVKLRFAANPSVAGPEWSDPFGR